MAIKLIIFDWDGTLVDSVQTIVGSLRSAAERLQLPVLSDQEYSHIIGLGMREAIDALYPGLSTSQVNDY
ncbi:MAG: HAD hydrolase-like protein, partial [Pseudomonadales bacterium]|nr:HAD hydrolase-like protein [Pseudomonadales bacterium]